ncbi:MAG: HU family DNA-binding protein [Methylococcaceae bacterium]|nr:HU family DNA-binding protein [Methylococcaceae bacterium]
MTQKELIAAISQESNLSIEEYLTKIITGTLIQEDQITPLGLGSFCIRYRSSRQSRNPQTGLPLLIQATNVPIFKPSKTIKTVLN